MQDWWLCTWRWKPPLAPAVSVAVHLADRSSGARKVLKSEREVERVPPGVADHNTLGIAAGAGLVAVHVACGCAHGGLIFCGEQSS